MTTLLLFLALLFKEHLLMFIWFFFSLSYVYNKHIWIIYSMKIPQRKWILQNCEEVAANSGLYWCYIAISSKGSKCTRPFSLFNLKENDFIRKKRTITLDVGECQSLMKPAEETNWVYGCRLAFRRWGCKRDLMVGWIIEILVTMLNNYSSSRDQSSADWTPSSC